MRSILLYLLIILSFHAFAQNGSAISSNQLTKNDEKLISINYRFVRDNFGLELKFVDYKQKKQRGTLSANLGYISYTDAKSISNATYKVNGYYGKLGVAFYKRLTHSYFFIGPNIILSASNQSIEATFKDPIWGTYIEEVKVDDINLGGDVSFGMAYDLSSNIFINFEGLIGLKLAKQVNPLTKKLMNGFQNGYNFPYYSPGMGDGSYLFVTGLVGIGYKF
jgi:hypothetical protein